MRKALALLLLLAACGKSGKAKGIASLGTSGLTIDLSSLDVDDPSQFVTETTSGQFRIEPPGSGLTTVYAKSERGMPTKSLLQAGVDEDRASGEAGMLEEGPNGTLIRSVTRTKCGSCEPGKPQHFIYVYVPTKDGAALCEGWSEVSPNDEHLKVCRTLAVAK